MSNSVKELLADVGTMYVLPGCFLTCVQQCINSDKNNSVPYEIRTKVSTALV
jgi:hypothetical protein